MMKAVPLTDHDANIVLHNLWQRGREEISLLGQELPDVKKLLQANADPRASFAIHFNNQPIAICGAFDMGNDEYSTWFLAVEMPRRLLVDMIPMLRGVILDKARDIGIKRLNCYSPCIHPRAPEWFKAIGFHEVLYTPPPGSPNVRRFVIDFV